MEEIVSEFFNIKPWNRVPNQQYELECRFGFVESLTRNDYENAIKKLKSLGFEQSNSKHLLRVVPLTDTNDPTPFRFECCDDTIILNYLNKKESVAEIIRNHTDGLIFEKKEYYNGIKPAFFPDYNFKVSFTSESRISSETFLNIYEKAKLLKFRCINRFSLSRKDYPFIIDFTIVQTCVGKTFEHPRQSYEIEIEAVNDQMNGLSFPQFISLFRKLITYVLCGIQETNYHISFNEREEVLVKYNELVSSELFIGPSVKTIAVEDIQTTVQDGYSVTDKADGERHLLYVNSRGRIYLISQKLKVIFTGCKTSKQSLYDSLLDGELILHSKSGVFINMYAAFDIFFVGQTTSKSKDIRQYTFQQRYKILKTFFLDWSPESVVKDELLPMIFIPKQFLSDGGNIFELASQILDTDNDYKIDGLIFTPLNAPVQNNVSLKWKFEHETTVDFLVHVIDATTIILKCGYTQTQLQLNPKDYILSNETFFESNEYVFKRFIPIKPYDESAGILTNLESFETVDGEVFCDKDIVEFGYDKISLRWIPKRIRKDKTRANNFQTANSNWTFIHFPVTEDMIRRGHTDTTFPFEDKYYNGDNLKFDTTVKLREFHNYIKRQIIEGCVKDNDLTLIDFCCGKGGDLHKWIHYRIKSVFGIDKSLDNIVNSNDGCYARYLNQCFSYSRKDKKMLQTKNIFCRFVNGDCSKDIIDGSCFYTASDYKIWKEMDKKEYDIGTCQFALHYFFESQETLTGLLMNISQTIKVGGFFAGCCFDGKMVFDKLLDKTLINCNDKSGRRIWCIQKHYKKIEFPDNRQSLGYRISVFQESINSFIDEYLVNFEFFRECMELIGFFPVADDTFESLYQDYNTELSDMEKEISFLNRRFIYQRKTTIADAQFISLD